jgi:D-amino peptidase
MKVFISADMEGISGVVDATQTRMEEKEYERARKLMTGEVNAAIEGALAAGATEILVNDSHGSMRNILIEELNPLAELITGSPKPLSMMQGIGPGYDACFFIGYHAQAGASPSILDHTYYGRVVYQATINGHVLGETGVNAALAGYFGVPVALVTGDRVLCQEARAIMGDIETVIVKEAYGRLAAKCLPPERARALIREASQRALSRNCAPFVIAPPYTLVLEVLNTALADMAELLPGARRTGPRRLEYVADDYLTLYKAFRTMIVLAGTLM